MTGTVDVYDDATMWLQRSIAKTYVLIHLQVTECRRDRVRAHLQFVIEYVLKEHVIVTVIDFGDFITF